MCYLCDKYGDPEHGNGLWYLNPRNYGRHIYKLREPGEKHKGPGGVEGVSWGPGVADLVAALEVSWEKFDSVRKEMAANWKKTGQERQVIPLQDAEKIMDLCSPIALMSCICRIAARARDERNELDYTCMGMGVGMFKWERWPERYKGGVKFVDPEGGKEWLRRLNKEGFVHQLMAFGSPYIGGFCMCDYPDCNSVRNAVDFDIGITLRSHYVAHIDYDKCNGCGICAQRCQFGALKFEVTYNQANVDQFKCYGCGLCETGCPRGAIKLLERKSLPALAEVW